ncbi:DUF4280 domain-containing protein [Chryseobacterium pennipullorum]|uniref:DUF4280 domain-containing protein n=1 Tax=Chryseobacterium pennipullorum TaxID=2258963 RepID=A0A3D9AXS6_9FLAO|nr:DUF4280 domain-containing protein [Chryseobacterium pennipullorum]REC46155.1 DUF4280 domain-containing protein [Chryseobacterium pennipullorum]
MSEVHLVCQGATCQCNFGTTPDKLKVNTQTQRYINDSDGSKKLVATHVDIGTTFEKNTFGSCKKKNNTPCQAVVTQWSGFYEKIIVEDNSGKVLLETSKATCPVGGPDCITIINHGQTAEANQKNVDNANQEVLAELIPFVNTNRKVKKYIPINR